MIKSQSRIVRSLKFLVMLIGALMVLSLLLFTLLLVVAAPIPQLVLHVRWCLDLGIGGIAILAVQALAMPALYLGLRRRSMRLRVIGLLIILLPIATVAIHHCMTNGPFWLLSLTGACLFSLGLIYVFSLSWFDETAQNPYQARAVNR